MKTRFYLIVRTDSFFMRKGFYDTMEEAELNKEFLEMYYGVPVRLKVDEIPLKRSEYYG